MMQCMHMGCMFIFLRVSRGTRSFLGILTQAFNVRMMFLFLVLCYVICCVMMFIGGVPTTAEDVRGPLLLK